MGQLFIGGSINLYPVEHTESIREFMLKLFSVQDIKMFFLLRDEYSCNLDAYVAYLAKGVANYSALNYIIQLPDGTQIGLITAELIRDKEGRIMWNTRYAVLPEFRRRGYAKEALSHLIGMMKDYKVQYALLEISSSNTPAEAVAQSCGFEKMAGPNGGNVSVMDFQRLYLGMIYKWSRDVKSLGKRDQLNQEGLLSYRKKDYQGAISLFEESLKEPYIPGSPFNDGLIYSNLGVLYTQVQRYQDAYNAMAQAYNLGIRNPSVIAILTKFGKNGKS